MSHRCLHLLAVAVSTLWLCALPAAAQQPLQLVDRIVAVVDEDPILHSEVEEIIALGLAAPSSPGSEAAPDPTTLRDRVIAQLVEQRLRFHAVERSGLETVSVTEVEAAVDQIVSTFPDRASFETLLADLKMTEAELNQLVARQLAVLHFVDERLSARVFVSLDDIRGYYRSELIPQLRAAGEDVPPLEEVREPIRTLLREQRLSEEVERWTEELRREADVLLFDAPAGGLPPVVG